MFDDKDALKAHYQSSFHRYNLKRKIAGLPPVTKEWFDARREQLELTASVAVTGPPETKQWMDPLTKKKFSTENTYLAYVRSKKYQDLVRKSGQPAPEVVIVVRREEEEQPEAAAPAPVSKPKKAPGFKVVPPCGGLPLMQDSHDGLGVKAEDTAMAEGSDWETASDVSEQDVEDMKNWEEWDLKRSLFDNHMSRDLESNLEYMFKHFGFYFPDTEFLKDPEGLLKYLGTKIQYGRVAIYSQGDDENAKQFASLHAVQRHMVDTNQCKMAYEGGEHEYSEFYDYGEDEDDAAGKQLITDSGPAAAAVLGGYELMLPAGPDGQGAKILGTREFARYYRQKHRPEDTRQSVVVNTVLCKYRALGIALQDEQRSLATKKATSKDATQIHWECKRQVRTEVWSNFVKQLGKGVGREY